MTILQIELPNELIKMQCISNVTNLGLSQYDFTWTYLHDPWFVPHIIAPFLIGIMARRPSWAFFVAVFWELWELTTYSIVGSFALFVDANDDTESIAAIAEDIYQGLFAAFLVKVYIWVFPAPRLIRPGNWKAIVYYWVMYLLMIAPGTMYVLYVNGFPLGIFLYPFIIGIIILLFEFTPCRPSNRWPKTNRVEYWLTAWIWTLVLGIQNMWCYAASSAVQTWIYTGFFVIYLMWRKSINF